ncbi:MAG: HD domain-containing protein [Rhodothermales bacterium]
MIKPRFKIFADPVHGFISVPRNLLLSLIHTPEVQRLRRIRQLGVGNLVYPGAEHTRFGHALGAMALMQDALNVLSEKGTPITTEEHTAALAAALLHDVGHGPFSHTLEHVLIEDFEHENMSRVLIELLNNRFPGQLDLVLKMFDNTYERPFFHQLISSQLDMDRLDYLRRDSFHTGVAEGEVGVARIIKTLRVHPLEGSKESRIAIEPKGIYAVENFLFARRLMYWQVYLHKTVVSGDRLLSGIIKRARDLLTENFNEIRSLTSPSLLFFLRNEIKGSEIEHPTVIKAYCELDDSDITYSLKQWMHCQDPVLVDLCRRFIYRSFLRVTYLDTPPTEDDIRAWKEQVAHWLAGKFSLSNEDAVDAAKYYLSHGKVQHVSYTSDKDPIDAVGLDGIVKELSTVTDNAAVAALTQLVEKPYVCYPKEINLTLEGLSVHENSDNTQ